MIIPVRHLSYAGACACLLSSNSLFPLLLPGTSEKNSRGCKYKHKAYRLMRVKPCYVSQGYLDKGGVFRGWHNTLDEGA